MHQDDRVCVAVINNRRDWELVQAERWYRLPVKHAPPGTPDFDWLAFYFTRAFEEDRWAIHYYAAVEGHELVARRDVIPAEPSHPRACQWYYKVQFGHWTQLTMSPFHRVGCTRHQRPCVHPPR